MDFDITLDFIVFAFYKRVFYFNLDPTSDTICLDDDQCAYRPKGYNCTNRENGLPVGSLQKKFEDHGRATLIFKNCNDHGYVKVLLNDIPIKALPRPNKGEKIDYGFYSDYYDDNGMWGSVGKIIMEAEFEVKPGDILTLEEVGATIKVFSLTIVRGKNFLLSIRYNEYVKRFSWFRFKIVKFVLLNLLTPLLKTTNTKRRYTLT